VIRGTRPVLVAYHKFQARVRRDHIDSDPAHSLITAKAEQYLIATNRGMFHGIDRFTGAE